LPDIVVTSNKPYLLRSLYEWLLDNEVTPYLLVDAMASGVSVPEGSANDGKVVLNLKPQAIQQLEMNNDFVSFSARFGGVSREVYCPMASVLAIYARENGEGMMFETELPSKIEAKPKLVSSGSTGSTSQKKPGLRVVK
jgi:stringent starvation protein B